MFARVKQVEVRTRMEFWRFGLKVSDEKVLAVFPDIEQFLEEDIVTESFLDKITSQYLEAAELPQFELISIETSSIDDLKKDE